MDLKSSPKSIRQFFIYVDRTSEGVPFYVGKGSLKRIRNSSRNMKHKHICAEYGFARVIEFETSNEKEALNRERALIIEYHTFVGDPLAKQFACNFTEGGDGTSGLKWTNQSRLKQKIRCKGKNNRIGTKHTEETKQKMSKSKLGSKNPFFGKPTWNKGKKLGSNSAKKGWETRRLLGKITHKPLSEASRLKISKANKGRKMSIETKEKIRLKLLGRKNPHICKSCGRQGHFAKTCEVLTLP